MIRKFNGYYRPDRTTWGGNSPSLYDEEDIARLNSLRFQNPDDLLVEDHHFLTGVSQGLREAYHMPVPLGTAIPTQHQAEAYTKTVRRFQSGENYVALFCEQGMGKSKISLMLLAYLSLQKSPSVRRILIVAPGALCRQWAEKEIPLHWHPKLPPIHVWNGGNTTRESVNFVAFLKQIDSQPKQIDSQPIFFLVNIEAISKSQKINRYLRQFIELSGQSAIVIDESSTIKNGYLSPKRKGTRRRGSSRANFLLDIAHHFDYRMILSGTPTPQSVVDLWSQFEFLKPGFFGITRYQFYLRHTITRVIPLPRGNRRVPIDARIWRMVHNAKGAISDIAMKYGLSVEDAARIREAASFSNSFDHQDVYEQISPVTIFGRVSDLLDLPPRRYIRVPCHMTREQTSLYEEMRADFFASIEASGGVVSSVNAAGMTEKLIQITGGAVIDSKGNSYVLKGGKIDHLSALILGFSDDEPAIYWAHHREEQRLVYEVICERFGEDVCGLYGGKDDHETIERFKSGEIFHMVSGSSAAFGHNFQHCHIQVFYSNSWRGDVRDQQEARTHRMGQSHTCFYYDLVVEDYRDSKGRIREAIDVRVLNVLKNKAELLDYFRGVE